MRRARRSRVASVTLDDLRELFHVPLQTAAASLQISETMVKRVARKFGIKKWPYRQVGWILAQVCGVQRKMEEGDKTTSLRRALTILEDARDTVYATGTVPADMIQSLCTELKTLTRSEPEPEHLSTAGKRQRDDSIEDMRTTRAMKRAISSSSTDSESSLSTSTYDISASDSPLSSPAAYSLPYSDDFSFGAFDDEFITTDPELVLVKAANYIFDPFDECFEALDNWM